MQVEDPAAIKQHIQALQSQKEQFDQEYSEGASDLTYAEHRAKMREFDSAVAELSARAAEAGALQRVRTAAEFDAWTKSVQKLRESTRGKRVDYRAPLIIPPLQPI